jgi:anti-sigma B factor antagonist
VTDRASGLRVVRSEAPCLNPREDRGQGPDETLTIRVRREPGYVLVIVAGEIDIATVSQLRARLSALAAAGRPLVADLDQVSYVDAAGLGALAGAAKRAAAHGTTLHVVCAVRQIRRLFGITGLDHVIPLAGTLAEALQALAAGSPLAVVPGGAEAV